MSFIVSREKKDDNIPPPQEEEDEDLIFDQTPVKVSCPNCGVNIITFIEHESSWVTIAVCIVLFLVLNWAAICIVPLVYPLFKDVVHHCPRCLKVLATRSRVVMPSFRQEVMSFRIGSCAMVLARKYVIALMAMMALIGGIHFVRSSGAPATGLDGAIREAPSDLRWEDFLKDCGFKSYLGNPIHVTVAFNDKFKNKTFDWRGTVHRVETGGNLLWFNVPGTILVNMEPAQFPHKRDMPDIALLYKEQEGLTSKVSSLKAGKPISFTATMLEVGRRGSPHVMALWDIDSSSSSLPADRSNHTASAADVSAEGSS